MFGACSGKTPPKGFSKRMIAAAVLVPTDIALAALDNTQRGDGWEPHNSTLRKVPFLYAITPKYASQAAYLQTTGSVRPGGNF